MNKQNINMLPVTLSIFNEDAVVKKTTQTLYIDGIANSVSTGKLIGYIQCCIDNGCNVEIIKFDQNYQEVDDILMDWIVNKMPLQETSWAKVKC
jgi:hypothetical protein|tara:strand:- start:1181 stop:1462 length:282 start_codon:yes stop_codon:yes gene_type:complete